MPTRDITIDQGATYSRRYTWTAAGIPVDLTGCTARMQVRRSIAAAETLLSLTHGDGITLGGDAGTIDITLSAATTAALPTVAAAVYDLEVQFSDGTVRRLLEGRVQIRPEVTR